MCHGEVVLWGFAGRGLFRVRYGFVPRASMALLQASVVSDARVCEFEQDAAVI